MVGGGVSVSVRKPGGATVPKSLFHKGRSRFPDFLFRTLTHPPETARARIAGEPALPSW